MTQTCPRCGAANPVDDRFCMTCGQALTPGPQAPSTPLQTFTPPTSPSRRRNAKPVVIGVTIVLVLAVAATVFVPKLLRPGAPVPQALDHYDLANISAYRYGVTFTGAAAKSAEAVASITPTTALGHQALLLENHEFTSWKNGDPQSEYVSRVWRDVATGKCLKAESGYADEVTSATCPSGPALPADWDAEVIMGAKITKVGEETVTVPAGTFQTDIYEHVENGGWGSFRIWVADGVPVPVQRQWLGYTQITEQDDVLESFALRST